MATNENKVDVQALLKQALPTGRWFYVGDDQHAAAVAALAKVIGKREANLPSWQRRLAISADGKTHLLAIDDCLQNPGSINWHSLMPEALKAIPTALPIEAAVAVLASPDNPEAILAARRKLAAEREAEQAEKARIAAETFRAEHAAIEKAAKERSDFRADTWAKVSPQTRFAARLAVAVAERDPKLAEAIRAAADGTDDAEDFPRAPWWTGLDKTMEGIRVNSVLATIPSEQRTILKVLHGTPAKMVAAWETSRARAAQ